MIDTTHTTPIPGLYTVTVITIHLILAIHTFIFNLCTLVFIAYMHCNETFNFYFVLIPKISILWFVLAPG